MRKAVMKGGEHITLVCLVVDEVVTADVVVAVVMTIGTKVTNKKNRRTNTERTMAVAGTAMLKTISLETAGSMMIPLEGRDRGLTSTFLPVNFEFCRLF